MNGALGKVLCLRNDIIFKQAFPLLRLKTSGENPICSVGGILLSTSRHHKTKPTHGIGRYKHLIKAQELKKKKGKVEVRPINLGTDYEYGVLNVHLTAYDMALAESYAQYIHNLCNHLSIKVEERYEMFLVWVACSALLLLNEVWRYNKHVVKSTLFRYIVCCNLNIE
uniref:Mitochondrial ribosomal protein L48 n=1 Tax=Rousettus aegyptiacus TaxID=9407 RepID=A0A7J8H2W1_ROUAE|nr:mitochondrial ribosomal protein L48 [Rousettus aegyptiacus]